MTISPKVIHKGNLPCLILMILSKHQNALRSEFPYTSYTLKKKTLLSYSFWISQALLLGSKNIRTFSKVALSMLTGFFLSDAQAGLGSLSGLEGIWARNCELIPQLDPAVVCLTSLSFPIMVLVHQRISITLHSVIWLPSGLPQFTLYLCISEYYIWTDFSPRVCQSQWKSVAINRCLKCMFQKLQLLLSHALLLHTKKLFSKYNLLFIIEWFFF